MFQAFRPAAQAAPVVWALLARRPGDNAQIETLAAATGLPVVVKRLELRKGLEALPNLRRTGSLFSYDAATQDALRAAPPPDLVIAAGKRSAPAALWLKARRGSRLLHLGRSWAPGAWFDAVLTTPQYGQPPGPNVVVNLFPLTPPRAEAAGDPGDLAALARPRLLVAAGGDAAGLRFGPAEAAALARRALERQRDDGGALMVATSPRTSAAAAEALKAAIPPSGDRLVSIFGEDPNRYRDFLAAADAAIVTEDSVSMAADAAATGRPVEFFSLTPRRDGSGLLRSALGAIGLDRRAAAAGLIDSGREIRAHMSALKTGGWLDGSAPARIEAELAAAAALARRLAAQAR
ncbi:ELM1/GtrOC1 family putative glycosyltransferase [Chenggangzhangella methanolivorans]|uniref:ELM1/GtrOC1 family putative glycosyltransferase n=1 Tax=Chenggangzhangella methanolivorans TaxID=1437009 RepID=UPI003620AF75